MDKRARRRKRKNAIRETMDMVKTILLVVIAVFAVAFVFLYMKQQLAGTDTGGASKVSVFGSLFKKQQETVPVQETEPASDVEVKTELKEGFHRNEDGRIVFIRNGQPLKDVWLDFNSSLYRIDRDGYVQTGEYTEDAFQYSFSADGVLTGISWDRNYTENSSNPDYPGLAERGSLKVYLNDKQTLGRFSTLLYKKSTVSHQLGGQNNIQYSGRGCYQIGSDGYVYWLPVTDSPDEMEAKINRHLYRLLPDSETRQIIADHVDGFRITESETGDTVIYYCKNGSMYRCGSANCIDDEPTEYFSADMDYVLDLQTEGRLYLRTASGYPVRKAGTFSVRGFTYELSENGEILSVEDNDKVQLGEEGSWYVDVSVFYDTPRSRVIWADEMGVESVISSEFTGECRNIYYSENESCFYSEYTFSDGMCHPVKISKAGDVDMLVGGSISAVSQKIYGFADGSVIVRNTDSEGNRSFEAVSVKETTPLAISVEPVLLEEETEETAETVWQSGPGQFPSGPGSMVQQKDPSGEAYGPGVAPGSDSQAPGGSFPGSSGNGGPSFGPGMNNPH